MCEFCLHGSCSVSILTIWGRGKVLGGGGHVIYYQPVSRCWKYAKRTIRLHQNTLSCERSCFLIIVDLTVGFKTSNGSFEKKLMLFAKYGSLPHNMNVWPDISEVSIRPIRWRASFPGYRHYRSSEFWGIVNRKKQTRGTNKIAAGTSWSSCCREDQKEAPR